MVAIPSVRILFRTYIISHEQVLSGEGELLASWLVRSAPDSRFQVRAQSWTRGHSTLTAPLSTQLYKWIPAGAIMAPDTREFDALGNPAMD